MADEPNEAGIREGNVPWAIGVAKGKVQLHYPQPVQFIAMDPENARQIAEGIARAAYEARYGVKPAELGSRLSEELRVRLVHRVAVVAGSMAREGKNNMAIAQAVVDVILKEVA